MNLEKALVHKGVMIEIARSFGFDSLAIHNQGTPWMSEDGEGNCPLAFVASRGSLVDMPECCARLELLLGCKVDIVIENPNQVNAHYFKNAVLLSEQDVEKKLTHLFEVPLAAVEFSTLQPIERAIAEGYIKKKDSQSLLFQGPQPVANTLDPSREQIHATAIDFGAAFRNICL